MKLFDALVVFLCAEVVYLGSYPWGSHREKFWK